MKISRIFAVILIAASFIDLSYAAMAPISDAEINIPSNLPFGEQLQRHSKLLSRLSEAVGETDLDKEAAKKENSLPKYLAAEEAYKNVQKVLAPYSIGRAKANALIEQGFRLETIEPKVCKNKNDCTGVDAITAVFFFDQQRGLGDNLKKKTQEAAKTKSQNVKVEVNGFDLTAFIEFLSGKPLDMATFGLLPAIRDALIPVDDTGEIAVWIRDPGKRSVEIVQNVRDGTLNALGVGGETNDLGRALKDPINCTVGKLFGRCN